MQCRIVYIVQAGRAALDLPFPQTVTGGDMASAAIRFYQAVFMFVCCSDRILKGRDVRDMAPAGLRRGIKVWLLTVGHSIHIFEIFRLSPKRNTRWFML